MPYYTTPYAGILFRHPEGYERTTILETLLQHEDGSPVGLDESLDLEITMPECGAVGRYPTLRDVPLVDVPCSCGNAAHWFIRWIAESATQADELM